MKKILMIIPAYNEEKSIVKTVESINKIESKNYKIDYVVINDGSTDNTKNVCLEIKFNFIEQEELNERELLSMEKEMLGIYISGHPLEKIREQIIASTNISSIQMKEIDEINSIGPDGENAEDVRAKSANKFVDGQDVKIAGIISSGLLVVAPINLKSAGNPLSKISLI